MAFDFMTVVQSISALIAAGTPALTYYVIIRTNTVQMKSFTDQCTRCRKELDSHLDCVEGEVGTITGRQKILREETLPEKFVPLAACRREHDKCVKDREKVEDALWTRINQVNDRISNGKSGDKRGGP